MRKLISALLISSALCSPVVYAAEPGTMKGTITQPSNPSPPPVYALPPVDAGPVWIVDIKRNGTSIRLDGYLNEGVPVKFMLDTGATAISLPRALAARIGAKEIRKIRVEYADGRTALESVVIIKRLQVGSVYVENIEAVVGDGDTPLLGKNFLDYFASYEINNKLAQLILHKD